MNTYIPNNFNATSNMQPMPFPNQRPMQPPTSSDASLYVGNLDLDIDDQRLFEFFSQYGAVSNVRVMRDAFSGESRGFGFVNFANAENAKRAKLVLNHTKIQNNEIKISFKRKPTENNPKANLYVSNIAPEVSARELETECAQFGTVVSCFIRSDDRGNRLGYGYVQFEEEKAAQDCIEGLNGLAMHEKELKVEVFVPSFKRAANQKTNLYVKNFPDSFSEEQVNSFIDESFGVFGEITSKGVFQNAKLGKFYAFVAFSKTEEAQAACEGLNGHQVGEGDNQLYVAFAMSKAQRKRMLEKQHTEQKNETNLYMRSIKLDVTEEQFRKAFEKYGEVSSIALKEHKFATRGDAEGPQLKFGFVNFVKTEEAKEAFTNAKEDSDITALVDQSHPTAKEFLFYAVNKKVRTQYLRMKNKNNRTSNFLEQMMRLQENIMKGQFGHKRGGRQGGRRGPRGAQNNFQAMIQQNPMIMQMLMMQNQGMNPQMNPGMNPGMNPAMNPGMMPQPMMQPGQGVNPMMGNPMFANPALAGQQAPAQPPKKDINWLKNNIDEFNRMDIGEQKNLLGTMMYSRVVEVAPTNLVPKITGMLIDTEVLGIAEIIDILENNELLVERIEEAVAIIEDDNEEN